MKPLLVTDATVVRAIATSQADIRIEEGRIVAIGKGLARQDCRIIDARGKLALPGGIDVHTHLNLRVGAEKVSDGFYHGSVAAAHGGTTCVVEHPGFGPAGCPLAHQIDGYRSEADNEVVVDYGLHGVVQHVDEEVLAAIPKLAGRGIPTIKVYLTYDGRLNDAGIIAIVALVSPYAADRDMAKSIIGPNNFTETFINTPLEECKQRAPELYAKAESGDIKLFSGITAPYETPKEPGLVIETISQNIEQSAEKILAEITKSSPSFSEA